jgi:hypothetical protein
MVFDCATDRLVIEKKEASTKQSALARSATSGETGKRTGKIRSNTEIKVGITISGKGRTGSQERKLE